MSEVSLTITLQNNGGISVNGPIENKILCFGMLELAKQTIFDFDPRKIQVANDIIDVVPMQVS